MSNLVGKFDKNIGPIISVGVCPAGEFPPKEGDQIHVFPALIDTGASSTCISPIVAAKVGLKPSGKKQMASASHSVEVNCYFVRIVLPFGDSGIAGPDSEIMEFNAQKDGPFQILLGRDVLCAGVFTMSFDGHFTFSL